MDAAQENLPDIELLAAFLQNPGHSTPSPAVLATIRLAAERLLHLQRWNTSTSPGTDLPAKTPPEPDRELQSQIPAIMVRDIMPA